MSETKEHKAEVKEAKKSQTAYAELAQSKFAGKYVVLDDSSGSLSLAGVELNQEDAEQFARRLASKRGEGAESTPAGLYVVHIPEPEAVSPGPTNPKFAKETNEPNKPGDQAAQVEAQKISDKADHKDKS